jgi:hypothetical protein
MRHRTVLLLAVAVLVVLALVPIFGISLSRRCLQELLTTRASGDSNFFSSLCSASASGIMKDYVIQPSKESSKKDSGMTEDYVIQSSKEMSKNDSGTIGTEYPALDPVQIFEEWKLHHSKEALRRTSLEGRKFIYASFSCPRRAGTLIHDFTNALLLAVATNRTLLYTYGGPPVYIRNGENHPDVCARILHRADWLPLYSDYENELPKAFKLEDSAQRIREMVDAGNVTTLDHILISPSHQWWGLDATADKWKGVTDLRDRYTSEYVTRLFGLETPLAQDDRVPRLYAEGPYFLFGMLFSQAFQMTEAILQSKEPDLPAAGQNDDYFSIGIHSRHTGNEGTGEDITREKACIDELLLQTDKPCRIYIMSDRTTTLTKIAEYATSGHDKHCEAIMVTNREKTTIQVLDEHGPFASAGYFQDLALVSQAQSASITRPRSSSALLVELMEYSRRTNAWKLDGTRELPDMLHCGMRSIHGRPR